MPDVGGESGSTSELLLGLRYYSAETSRFVLRPEHLPRKLLELCFATIGLTLMLFYIFAEGEEDDGGVAWDDLPSLSRAGAIMPSAIPFQMGVSAGSLLLFWTLWLVHATQNKKLSWNSARRMPVEYTHAKLWSRRCMWVGMVFAVLVAVTGAVSVEYSYVTHAVLMCVLLVVGALYAVLLLRYVLKQAPKLFLATVDDEKNYRRKWWLSLGICIGLAVDVCVCVIVVLLPEMDCPLRDPCLTRALRSGSECFAVLCLLGFVLSLRHDLHGVVLELTI